LGVNDFIFSSELTKHFAAGQTAAQRNIRAKKTPAQPALQAANNYISYLSFSLCLFKAGGSLRQSVWKILTEIPYGEIITYGGFAKKTAAKTGKKNYFLLLKT
jgi:O6-methylguanine-DNA--protein-cysteine methyltransferase